MSHVIIAVQGSSYSPTFLMNLLDTLHALSAAGHTFNYIARDSICSYDNFIDTVKTDINYDCAVFIDSHSAWNPSWVVDMVTSGIHAHTYGSRDVFVNTDTFDIWDRNNNKIPLSTKSIESDVVLGHVRVLKLSKEVIDRLKEIPYTGEKFAPALSSAINKSGHSLHCDFSKLVLVI